MTANPANTALFYFLGHKAGIAFLSHHRSQKKCQDSHCTPVSGIYKIVIILIANQTKCVSTSDKSIAVEKRLGQLCKNMISRNVNSMMMITI